MLNLTKPRYVMPFHGDHKRIHLHGQLAEAVGVDPDNIFKGENGLPLELDAKGARWGKKEQSGMIFVDGVDIGDVADVALRDRRMLSADGIFVVVATISEQDGSSVAEPEVIFRGVPYADEADKLLDQLRDCVETLARPRRQGGDPRDRPAPGDPPRRPRGVRLRQASSAARWCCRSSSRSSARVASARSGSREDRDTTVDVVHASHHTPPETRRSGAPGAAVASAHRRVRASRRATTPGARLTRRAIECTRSASQDTRRARRRQPAP